MSNTLCLMGRGCGAAGWRNNQSSAFIEDPLRLRAKGDRSLAVRVVRETGAFASQGAAPIDVLSPPAEFAVVAHLTDGIGPGIRPHGTPLRTGLRRGVVHQGGWDLALGLIGTMKRWNTRC